ncbi:hypothetical protein DIPPA_11148 [Diplonema papillatum]|nr:hypothetical protein DIPPA_11148 [Diplonema papillatum]
MSLLLVLVSVFSGTVVGLFALYCYARAERRKVRETMSEAIRARLLDGGKAASFLPEPVSYTVYHNHFAGGLLSAVFDGKRLLPYNVYAVRLHSADAAFNGVRQEWCKAYKPAQLIFGEGPTHATLRAAIHAEHATLYRETGFERVTTGHLRTPSDLCGLLCQGTGDAVDFTYVIMPSGEWRFSPTSSGLVKDALSKHVVHSDAEPAVLYAGEFRLQGDTLVLNNSSGTYSPDKAHFPMLKQLFRANFPSMKVECEVAA